MDFLQCTRDELVRENIGGVQRSSFGFYPNKLEQNNQQWMTNRDVARKSLYFYEGNAAAKRHRQQATATAVFGLFR